MTLLDIAVRVAKIKAEAAAGYDFAAHVLEDELFAEVLKAIAAGDADPQALAEEAVKTLEIYFQRYYS